MNKFIKNSLAILMSAAMLITSFAAFAAEEGETAENTSAVSSEVESYLKGFGIFSDSEAIDNSEITRTQAANYFIKASGFDYGTIAGDAASFADVSAGSEAWKVSEAALRLGIVTMNDERMFYPSRAVSVSEAAAMAVRTMRAEPIAALRGGYPNGYMEIARDSYLFNGTSGKENITKADAAMLIYNMHKAYMYEISYEGDRLSYTKSTEKTVAEDLLNVERLRVDFIDTNSSDNSIEVKYIGGTKKGQTEKLYAADTIDVSAIGGSGYIYVSKDSDEILFIEVKKGSEVQYDYIYEVNNLEKISPISVEDIDTVTLRNSNKKYDMSEEVAVYYEDKRVTTEAYDYIGTFAKVVVQDDEIIRLDIYPLHEGGLVRYAVTEELRFDVLEDTNHWYDMEDFATLEVYIDGIKVGGIIDLRENYVFDYWYDGEQNKMMIVASSRGKHGKVEGFKDSNKIKIDGVYYETADSVMTYNEVASEFRSGFDSEDISGQQVTVYFSDDMKIRFIRKDTVNVNTNIIRGVITNAYTEKGTGDKYLEIFHVDDSTGEHTYKVADKLKSSSLSFEYAKSVSKDYEGGGFLEFTLNGDGEVKNIGRVDYFGYTATFTGHNIPENQVVCNQYVGQAKWFLLLDIDGEFTVKKTTYNQMMYMHPVTTARFISDYDVRQNPVPQYFMGLGWTDSYTAFDSYAFIKDIQYIDDEYSKLVFANNSSYTVSNDYIAEKGLGINTYIMYRATRASKEPIIVYDVKDFSGDSDTWQVDEWSPEATGGIYRADDLSYRNDYVVQFIVDGEVTDTYKFKDRGITSGDPCIAYRHDRDTFSAVTMKYGTTDSISYIREYRGAMTMNLRKGDKIWFHLNSSREVDWFIFESGPDSYMND